MSKTNNRLILVTGATGKQGGAVLRHLREKGFPVRALTRDPDKPEARALIGHGTEVVRGDLDDRTSLARALDGVYGVYSVQSHTEKGIEGEIHQGIALADAARSENVSHLVYSSVGSADQHTGVPHFDSKFQIEEHIRKLGLPYTIIRPVFFMENWLGMRARIESGTLTLPLKPDTRLQMIAVDDIGAFVAMAFEFPGRWQSHALDIAGDELSMNQVSQALGRLFGEDVKYVQAPWDKFEQQAGHEMMLMFKWFEDVGYHADIPVLRQQHQSLMSFERWMHSKLVTSVIGSRP
jgi:uncharacterized protein YbjT (DUF2867 family)